MQRIDKVLPNGHKLVVTIGEVNDFPYEVNVYVEDEDGMWLQDLVNVGNCYTFLAGDIEPRYIPGVFDVHVWGDPNDESFTDEFTIPEVKEEREAD